MLSGNSQPWIDLARYPPTLLYSRIEPDLAPKLNQNKFIITQVPRADRPRLQAYHRRAEQSHPHLPRFYIDQKSPFYVTVYTLALRPFQFKDLLLLPLPKRAQLLTNVLTAAAQLAKIYGFFYITEKMLGYDSENQIVLWISEELFDNNRKFPINHGKLSEQIFIADFKDGFGGNLRDDKEFKSAKTVQAMLDLLKKTEHVTHSIYVGEKDNGCYDDHKRQYAVRSQINWRESYISSFRDIPSAFKNSVEESQCLSRMLKRDISCSYIPNHHELNLSKSPKRDLFSSLSMQSLNANNYDALKMSNNSISIRRMVHSPSPSKSLSQSTLPKIQFSYREPNNVHAWKKKEPTSQISLCSFMHKSASFNFKEATKQSLKVSFPHTTNHTFLPFASNGNISINYHESINFAKKGLHFEYEHQNQFEPHISQESNEVQMDLQNLFSESSPSLQSHEQFQHMEMIMQQFENVLLA